MENVLADGQLQSVAYEDKIFVPASNSIIPKRDEATFTTSPSNNIPKRSGATTRFLATTNYKPKVDRGFKDAWYGDQLRDTVLQYKHGGVQTIHVNGHSLGEA